MDEEVRKELEALKGMVLAWKESYRQAASPGGQDEHLADDFWEEVQTHTFPYTRRLFECQYLSESELQGFVEFCCVQVEELRQSLRIVKA